MCVHAFLQAVYYSNLSFCVASLFNFLLLIRVQVFVWNGLRVVWPCSAVCVAWSGFTEQNSIYAVNMDQFTTLADCLSYCVSNALCVAVDFDTSATPCWIHTDISSLDDDNTFHIPGISQFILDRSCTVIGRAQFPLLRFAWICQTTSRTTYSLYSFSMLGCGGYVLGL